MRTMTTKPLSYETHFNTEMCGWQDTVIYTSFVLQRIKYSNYKTCT